MADAGSGLMRLAVERFGNLRPGEVVVLRSAEAGTVANVAREGDETLKSDSAWGCWEAWGEHRTVRAELLRWLLTDPDASRRVHEHGVSIENARIEGVVDLFGASIPRMLIWSHCAIPDGMVVNDACIPIFNLCSSHIRSIFAERLRVNGSVFFNDGFKAWGGVSVAGATIGGDLECKGGKFVIPATAASNPLMYSLDALLPIIEFHQERFWLPMVEPRFGAGWWVRVYLWVHIGLGWFLGTLLVVGLSGLVKRDDREEEGPG